MGKGWSRRQWAAWALISLVLSVVVSVYLFDGRSGWGPGAVAMVGLTLTAVVVDAAGRRSRRVRWFRAVADAQS